MSFFPFPTLHPRYKCFTSVAAKIESLSAGPPHCVCGLRWAPRRFLPLSWGGLKEFMAWFHIQFRFLCLQVTVERETLSINTEVCAICLSVVQVLEGFLQPAENAHWQHFCAFDFTGGLCMADARVDCQWKQSR